MTAAIYRADWVIPVSRRPIRDGAVRVDATGRIEWVGPAVELESGPTRDLGSSVILPGLVNVHGHPELTLARGALEDEPFPAWLFRLKELKYGLFDEEASRLSTWLGLAESIAAGITCLGAPDDAGFLAQGLRESGLRGRVYREVFGPDPSEAEAAMKQLRARVDETRSHAGGRVEVGVSPHAPYTVSARLFRLVAEYASAEALPVTVHVAESQAEDHLLRHGTGPFAEKLRGRGIEVAGGASSAISWLNETGIMATRPLLAHCVRVDADDIRRVRDAGASIAHCPISNAKFGHGVAPLVSFLEHGIAVGLGSDSVASNNRVDILEEARTAALLQRSGSLDPVVLDAGTCLELATLGGARALGLDGEIGSLDAGKAADLIAIRLDTPWTTPAGDPVSALIHGARGSDVVLTVVEGTVLYEDGRFTTLDWPGLRDEARRLAATRLETRGP